MRKLKIYLSTNLIGMETRTEITRILGEVADVQEIHMHTYPFFVEVIECFILIPVFYEGIMYLRLNLADETGVCVDEEVLTIHNSILDDIKRIFENSEETCASLYQAIGFAKQIKELM